MGGRLPNNYYVSKLLFIQVLIMVTVFFIYQPEEVRAAKQSRFRSYKATREKERQVVVLPVLAGVVSGLKWEEDIVFFGPLLQFSYLCTYDLHVRNILDACRLGYSGYDVFC
jgi:hypothetical protein